MVIPVLNNSVVLPEETLTDAIPDLLPTDKTLPPPPAETPVKLEPSPKYVMIPEVAVISGHKTWSQLSRYTRIKPEQLIDKINFK